MPASRKAAKRTVRMPRPDFSTASLPCAAFAGLNLFRIHSRDHAALTYRKSSNHRFSHPNAPSGFLYLGESVETCIWECFGDELMDNQTRLSLARWENSRLSRVHSSATFHLCDLTDETVRLRLGVDLASLMSSDLAVSQEWGLAIQTHSVAVDGLRYLSRFNGEPAFVIFEKPGTASNLSETLVGSLPDVAEADQFLIRQSIGLV